MNGKGWHYYGFDHKEELLELGRKKNLMNTEFHLFDLNAVNPAYTGTFDVVTCFETLEHTGNYKNAFENLFLSCRSGGLLVMSIPNETGVPGILKFFGRKMKRYNVYGNFFEKKSEISYIMTLFLGGDIESFRDREATGWGPHLGFDYKKFESFLEKHYISWNRCALENRSNSILNFNKIFIVRKIK